MNILEGVIKVFCAVCGGFFLILCGAMQSWLFAGLGGILVLVPVILPKGILKSTIEAQKSLQRR